MRKIKYDNQFGEMELEVQDQFVSYIASRNGVQLEELTDTDILVFFNLVSNVALDRAAAEYVETNGTNT